MTIIRYAHSHTYDILPDSESGTYYAGGLLIGSTLWHGAAPLAGTPAPQSR